MSQATNAGSKVILLIIDPQVDFHEGGSLAVSFTIFRNTSSVHNYES